MKKKCFICHISNCHSFSWTYLQRIAGYRGSSPYTLFPKLLTTYGDSRGFGSPVSSGLDDTACLREGHGLKLWRTRSPIGNLMSSLYIATMFPEKQQHTSLAAEADTALRPSSFPVLGRALSLLTAAGGVGSQKSLSGAWGLLCSRGHRKEASDRTGNHSRTAACSLDLPIWLSALSQLLWTWTRRGKFINSPAHWINLLWHSIFQAASVADLKPGQHYRNHLGEQHLCNVGTRLSHTDTFSCWLRRT